MKASDFHNLHGDVVPLDIFTYLSPFNEDQIESKRYGENHIGKKDVYRFNEPPQEWNISKDCVTAKPIRVESNRGSFFLPHKDFIDIRETNDWVRLNCFVTNASSEDCTYIIDNKIQHFEEGRWYLINPRKTHYSFTFTDNTVHYVVNLKIRDEKTFEWIYRSIQHHKLIGDDREGYK